LVKKTRTLGVRSRHVAAVAASLGLIIASALININMEVAMRISIVTTVQMNMIASCLAAGIGWLGSLVSS
jgi:hypothetical protein